MQMSSLAFNLLSFFLAEHDLVLIAAIVNDKVHFEKSRFHESLTVIDSNELLVLPAYSSLNSEFTGLLFEGCIS